MVDAEVLSLVNNANNSKSEKIISVFPVELQNYLWKIVPLFMFVKINLALLETLENP